MRVRWNHAASLVVVLCLLVSLPQRTVIVRQDDGSLWGITVFDRLSDQLHLLKDGLKDGEQLMVWIYRGQLFFWSEVPVVVPLCLVTGAVLLNWRRALTAALSVACGGVAGAILGWKVSVLVKSYGFGVSVWLGPGLYFVLASALVLIFSGLAHLFLLRAARHVHAEAG